MMGVRRRIDERHLDAPVNECEVQEPNSWLSRSHRRPSTTGEEIPFTGVPGETRSLALIVR